MCLIVRSREDCRATEIDATPGTAQVYSLPRQLFFFSELRPMLYVKCQGAFEQGYYMIAIL